MVETSNYYNIFMAKHHLEYLSVEGDNIKTGFKNTVCEYVDWIEVAQSRI